MSTVYTPIIKKKGFNPNPIAGKIPFFADGRTNPEAIGKSDYQEFWEEQYDRCINGYQTGGVFLPGRYYWYLNFVPLRGLMGIQYPWYVDFDQEFFTTVDQVKKYKQTGIIVVKARRKGLSEKVQGGVLSYGSRFIDGYRGAVTAGLETYVTGLRKKYESSHERFVEEVRLNELENNEKLIRYGFEIKDPIGGYREEGYGGHISFETMFDKAEKLEGEYFHDVVCEESGQYPKLGKVYTSIRPALEFGSIMMGTFFIYGTGGNILSTSKDFKDMWDNASKYGLVKMWVPGTRLYYPFFGNKHSEVMEDAEGLDFEDLVNNKENINAEIKEIDAIPNLRHLKKWQRIGCEDVKTAEEYILKKRIEFSKLPNKKKLKEWNQKYPLTIEEAWTSGGNNNFNDEKIYNKLFELESSEPKWKPYVLEPIKEKDENGNWVNKVPLEIKARKATRHDESWKIVKIYQHPMPDILDLDIGGIDGYNQDVTQSGSSLGAMTVVRQGNRLNLSHRGVHNAEYPIMIYYERPPRKEQFFEICLYASVYYNLLRNTMCNAEQDFVIDYYVKNHGIRYLSERPKTFDAPKTKQVHKYGVKMTGSSYSKENLLGVVQSMVEDYIEYWEFIELLRDLLAYDEEFVGTDWDIVDALAYAKSRIEDMRMRPRKANQNYNNAKDDPVWTIDENGNPILVDNGFAGKNTEVPEKEIKGNWKGWM